MGGIDFTDCRRIFGKAYNGANGKKIAVEYNGAIYMLKFPPSAEKNRPRYPIRTVALVSILPAPFFKCSGSALRRRCSGLSRYQERQKSSARVKILRKTEKYYMIFAP